MTKGLKLTATVFEATTFSRSGGVACEHEVNNNSYCYLFHPMFLNELAATHTNGAIQQAKHQHRRLPADEPATMRSEVFQTAQSFPLFVCFRPTCAQAIAKVSLVGQVFLHAVPLPRYDVSLC